MATLGIPQNTIEILQKYNYKTAAEIIYSHLIKR